MPDAWNAHADALEKHGMYSREHEHDACGVGMVASIDGAPRREVVESGIEALKSVWHRGAVNADGKTGDGAGVHLQIPKPFFRDYINQFARAIPEGVPFAVGMLFLPRTNFAEQEESRLIIETVIINFGYEILGWRQVPVNPEVLGQSAEQSRPEIAQIFIRGHEGESEQVFERNLYVIRRRIEKRCQQAGIRGLYVCSLSSRTIIYKGLFSAEQLAGFYTELNDARFISNFIIFHQRFSTNTAPAWHLAQPFHVIAHNGEINTLRGNVNWMGSYEAVFGSDVLQQYAEDLIPIVPLNSSDTGVLNAVLDLLIHAEVPLPMAKLLCIPPAWSHDASLPDHHRAFFEYCTCLMSPWDGPAAIMATDGNWVMAGMDRNGLRPMRYAITQNGLLLMGSETGMVPVKRDEIIELGRLGPGQMIGIDLSKGKLFKDYEMKDYFAAAKPFREWVDEITHLDELTIAPLPKQASLAEGAMQQRLLANGFTTEDLELILTPMVTDGKEPVGSMGDDTPLAVLSKHYRGLHHYFRQHFSQVTNPPIDPLREHYTMSLITRVGRMENILKERTDLRNLLHLDDPLLFTNELQAVIQHCGEKAVIIDATFAADGSSDALKNGIEEVAQAVEEAVRTGAHTIILTDEYVSASRCAIPSILAVGAVHTRMVRCSLRKKMSLIVRSAACMDVHHYAVLIGIGATVVNPYIAEDLILSRHAKKLFDPLTLEQCFAHYRNALNQGLLKVMSKMGISVVSSYRGGRNFDAIGLSRSLVAEFFPGLISRISGIGLRGIELKVLEMHHRVFMDAKVTALPVGGLYKYRASGETHALQGELIHMLQSACGSGKYQTYKKYSDAVAALPPINLRDLLDFRSNREPIALNEVEPVTDIRKRFVAPAMSLGALSPEAHEVLAIAMNRIGAASNSGEGGEGSERFYPNANGDNANSTIKQVASARFGVTAHYLNHCKEIQIKVAQGAKPGEGGQLPGFKVTEMIARLRHATPGVTLISPPPHHDIYSIEDLAQLIYDLKQINPTAIVSVKLVAQSGIGTIASGVAKAKADKILIAGHVGGTGASPYSSIKHAGAPWEMGLAEANQVLTLNGLRNQVTLQTDGGLKTGRDIVIAAILGAEEYGIGTLSLVAMGCLLVRQCHSNTCPVGICTQDEELRQKFGGTVEKVIHLMSFIAEEVREILACLGYASLNDIIGRTELLHQIHSGSAELDALDLGPLLTQPAMYDAEGARVCTREGRVEVADSLDEQMIKDARGALENFENIQLSYTVNNTHRTIGTRLSSMMCRKFNTEELNPDHVTVSLRGSAGQSLGAFLVRGVRIEVLGDANDYVGKGLSGGTIILRPAPSSQLETQKNVIIGNTVLYGATSGKLFASGMAGERFAVRNSGAITVVEGCGDNGCEYMTGGTAIILGHTGNNFAAGMTGGMAFVYDKESLFEGRVNPENVVIQRLSSTHWEDVLKTLIAEHAKETGSLFAENILNQWEYKREMFWQVCPKEMLRFLSHPLSDEQAGEAKLLA